MKKIIGSLILLGLLTSVSLVNAQDLRNVRIQQPKGVTDPIRESKKQQMIIDSNLRSLPGSTPKNPSDPNCPATQQPELILENLKLTSIGQSEDYSSLEYRFSLDIKNFYNKPFGPLNATKGVSLSIFDGTKLQADGLMNNVTYGQLLADYSLATMTLTDNAKAFKIACNQSMNFKDITLSLPKDAALHDLIFMIDSKNQIQEKNDTPSQNGKTNASLKDNNVANYQIAQPFKSFNLAVSNYNFDNQEIEIGSSFNFLNSNAENDLKSLGYNFVTEIWKIDGGKFNELKNIGLNPEYDIQFLGGFIKNKPEFTTEILNTSEMSNNPASWTTNEDLALIGSANHFAVLSMKNANGEKYPLYVIKPVLPADPDEEWQFQNCNYKAGECKYLIFTRTSEEVVETETTNITEASPQVASSFQACNYTDAVATVQSLKFNVFTGANQVANGVKITNTFEADGQSIWNSINYANYGTDSAKETSEIVLDQPMVINPTECHEIKVNTISAHQAYKYELINLNNVKSDITPYFFDPYNNILQKFENGWELIGTDTVFAPEEGAVMVFDDYPDGRHYAYDTNEYINLIYLGVFTNPNQTFNFDQLDFHISSNYTGDLPGKLSILPVDSLYGWSNPEVEKDITLPSNGDFSLEDLNVSLSYNQKYRIFLKVIGPFESEGKITANLVGLDSSNNLTITKQWPALPYNKDWIPAKNLPLSNTIYLDKPLPVKMLKFNVFPNSWWGKQNWFSSSKLGKEFLWQIGIDAQYENYSIPIDIPLTEEILKTIKLSNLDLVIDGSFDQLNLKFTVNGNTVLDKIVSPGDTVTLPLPKLDLNSPWINIQVALNSYPDLDLFDVRDVEIIPQPITAVYFDDTKIPVTVDQYKLTDDGSVKTVSEEFLVPYVDADTFFLGKELLYLSSDFNSPVAQTKKIALLKEDEKIEMNNTCFMSIGDIRVEKIIYQHDAHDVQPFDKVILNYNGEDIYLPLADWSLNEAVFKPTPPTFLEHNWGYCLHLFVNGPKEPLKETYFDLVGIEAVVDGTAVSIPVISNKNSKDLLSPDKSIKGTVTNFK